MLVARTSADPKNLEAHCEALLIDRLMAEPCERLAELKVVLLYSFLCPCPSCAGKIAAFAAARPGLRVEVAYERHFIPAAAAQFRAGISDASSVEAMRAAGISVVQFDSTSSEPSCLETCAPDRGICMP